MGGPKSSATLARDLDKYVGSDSEAIYVVSAGDRGK